MRAIPYTTYRVVRAVHGPDPVHGPPPGVRAARPRGPLHHVPHGDAAVPGRGAVLAYAAGPGGADVLRAGHDVPTEVDYVPQTRVHYVAGAGRHGARREGLHRALRDGDGVHPRPGRDAVRPHARHVRVRPLHLHEPLLPRPGGPAAGAVPRPDGVQEGVGAARRVPRVSDCKMVCKPVCTTVQVPVCRKVCQTEMRTCTRTVCRMVPEQCVRYETRTRCYQVPEEKVCQIPYTTCKMVPEHHVRTRDAVPLLHGARAPRPLPVLHDLPDGARRSTSRWSRSGGATTCRR